MSIWVKGCLDSWENTVSRSVYEDVCPQKRLTFKSVCYITNITLNNLDGHHLISEDLNRTRGWVKGKFTLFAWVEIFIFSCLWTSAVLFWGNFSTRTELYHRLYWFSILQMANCGTSQLPYSCEPLRKMNEWINEWTNECSIGFVSLEDSNTTDINFPEGLL